MIPMFILHGILFTLLVWVHNILFTELLTSFSPSWEISVVWICFRMEKESVSSVRELEVLLLWACGKAWWVLCGRTNCTPLVAVKQNEEGLVPSWAHFQCHKGFGLEFHLSEAQSQPTSYLEDYGRTSKVQRQPAMHSVFRINLGNLLRLFFKK